MKKHKIVGASISVIDSTGIIFSKGYGFADKANNKVVSPATVFPFGSISKVITMASVLKLQDFGRRNIDSNSLNPFPTFK